MHPLSVLLSLPLFAVFVAAGDGGAGYNTSRVGPSNADCERKTYAVKIDSNNTVFDRELSSSVNEVLDPPISLCVDQLTNSLLGG